jgi:predicted ferric reductase
MFLNFPEVALLERHPFCLSSGPNEASCEVMIKVLGDFTKKLVEQAALKQNLWIRVDGPYGKWQCILSVRLVVVDPYCSSTQAI